MEVAEIASLRRRCLAILIDGVVTLMPIALATAAGVWLHGWYNRRRKGSDAVKAPDISPGDGRISAAFRRVGESRRWQLALRAVSLPIEIRMRNWRSPGMRAMGIRRADARSGGPLTVRNSVARAAAVTAWREMVRGAERPSVERVRERGRLMEADLEEVRRRHADDPDARQRAMAEVVKRYGISPSATCGRAVLSTLPLCLPALWSERHQTLPDRLAGIIVVRD